MKFALSSWVDEVETSLLNIRDTALDSREDLTASIGYHAENWSLVAFGRNLTNERTEVPLYLSTLFANGTLNRPRSLGVEFTVEL